MRDCLQRTANKKPALSFGVIIVWIEMLEDFLNESSGAELELIPGSEMFK